VKSATKQLIDLVCKAPLSEWERDVKYRVSGTGAVGGTIFTYDLPARAVVELGSSYFSVGKRVLCVGWWDSFRLARKYAKLKRDWRAARRAEADAWLAQLMRER